MASNFQCPDLIVYSAARFIHISLNYYYCSALYNCLFALQRVFEVDLYFKNIRKVQVKSVTCRLVLITLTVR